MNATGQAVVRYRVTVGVLSELERGPQQERADVELTITASSPDAARLLGWDMAEGALRGEWRVDTCDVEEIG